MNIADAIYYKLQRFLWQIAALDEFKHRLHILKRKLRLIFLVSALKKLLAPSLRGETPFTMTSTEYSVSKSSSREKFSEVFNRVLMLAALTSSCRMHAMIKSRGTMVFDNAVSRESDIDTMGSCGGEVADAASVGKWEMWAMLSSMGLYGRVCGRSRNRRSDKISSFSCFNTRGIYLFLVIREREKKEKEKKDKKRKKKQGRQELAMRVAAGGSG